MGSDLYHTADRSVRLEAAVTSLAVIAFAYLVGLVLASLGVSVADALGVTEATAPVVYYSVQYALLPAGFLVAVFGYHQSRETDGLVRFHTPTLRDLGWIVLGFLVLLAASTALEQIIGLLGVETAQNQAIITGREHPLLFLALLPITVLLVAPGEELLFRGLVQGKFRQAYGSVPAVVIASLLFGLSHSGALSGAGTVTYLAVATVLGLILGAVYEHTESILVPVGIHAAWNVSIYLGQWLQAVYGLSLLG
ncbi:type II CAAX prenyl endopeptidase Rce1 family protein [Halomicrobium sp. LC1Hm]|uniref:CPBP family glutamic-type intramembrane protease n=1 Tax=Halomicrobium sp. LC1Hm TaxID=2610902 RepID=UPI0012982F84|nr:CPBP family glutamic-type intramembrane protease [Halomicrobium sp. LC1Hm]QGA81600.1 Metal-dependent membrane protease, CAAX family [Halomicrobium sp. LC1Hm]